MEEEGRQENIFRDLVPTAKKVLHQKMLDPNNAKLAVQVAESVLDRAGETRQADRRIAAQIVITNSQVAVLTKVASEVEAQIAIDGGLYQPTPKELEHAGRKTD